MVIKRILVAIFFMIAHTNPASATGVVISPTGSGVFAADNGTSSSIATSNGKPVVNTTAAMNTGTLDVLTEANTPTSIVNVYLDNKNTLGSAVNVNLDLSAKFNKAASYAPVSSQDASNALVVTSFLGNITADVSGYEGLAGKNSSMICADRIMAGDYGVDVKTAFEARRQADSALSLSVCDATDVASVTNAKAPVCSIGTYDNSKNGQSSPIFTVKKAVKKRKCERDVAVGYQCYLQTYNYECGFWGGLMTGIQTTPKAFSYTMTGLITNNAGTVSFSWRSNIYPSSPSSHPRFSSATRPNFYEVCSGSSVATPMGTGAYGEPISVCSGSAAKIHSATLANQGSLWPVYDYNTGSDIRGSYPAKTGNVRFFESLQGPFSGYFGSFKSFKSKQSRPTHYEVALQCQSNGPWSEGYTIFGSGNVEYSGGWISGTGAPFRVGDAELQIIDTGSISKTCSAWKAERPAYDNYEIAQSVLKTQKEVTWVDDAVTTTCPAGTNDMGLSDDWSNNPADYQNPANQVSIDCAYGTNCGAGVQTSFTSTEQRGEILRPDAGETGSMGGRVDALVYSFTGVQTGSVTNGSNGTNGAIDINAVSSPKFCADIKNTTAEQIKVPILNIEKVMYFPWDLRPVSYSESKTFPTRNQTDYFKIYTGITEPFRDYLKRVNCPTCPR
ncbi:hypothetical protein [Bdellovibrio sp. BCCA]|uniref:hypothetical protein n=1 Tax=Bdellovibrio sp. BCCA TaxID=3136281 RepID=UPI0030F33EEC